MRLLMLFALATLAVIGVIAVLFIGNFRQSQRDSIVLPDAAQSAQPAAQQPGEEPSLLEVSRSNVQSIVRYLHRPQYYHQSYTITRQMGGASSESTAASCAVSTPDVQSGGYTTHHQFCPFPSPIVIVKAL